MTARIQRDFQFVAGTYIDNEIYLNSYDVEVNFIVESENILEQNIALDRVKYFFIEKLDNALFINEAETDTIEKFVDTGMKVLLLPEEPYDQIVGILLLTKMNAITESRLVVTDIVITSRMSDGVSYMHSVDENSGPFMLKGWWADSGPNTTTRILKGKTKKVVKLTKTISSWEDISLGWNPKSATHNEPIDAVLLNFEKSEK
jgi:hypothetical protein